MSTILNVDKICKSFGNNKALDNVSFKVKSGQIMGFIGPNGAGKTTAIKVILGLQKMDSGNVYINNNNINKNFEKALERVGAIVENPDSYTYLTGRENLKLIANLYNDVKDEYIEELIDLVKLRDSIDLKVSKYSLGMRQRLGIASSLINKPNLLVLDEPTNGLDPEGIKDLRDIIINIVKKNKSAVLVSSHNLAELDNFCTDICLINKGKIVEIININDIKKKDEPSYSIVVDKSSGLENFINKGEKINNKTLKVMRNKDEIALLVKELVLNGYKIYEVKKDAVTLEEAYLKEIGGNIFE